MLHAGWCWLVTCWIWQMVRLPGNWMLAQRWVSGLCFKDWLEVVAKVKLKQKIVVCFYFLILAGFLVIISLWFVPLSVTVSFLLQKQAFFFVCSYLLSYFVSLNNSCKSPPCVIVITFAQMPEITLCCSHSIRMLYYLSWGVVCCIALFQLPLFAKRTITYILGCLILQALAPIVSFIPGSLACQHI